MKLFKKWRERREQRRKLRELSELQRVFGTLKRLENCGMIAFDQKQRRLFIEQPVAVLMMRNAASWLAFLQNTFRWLYYRQCQEAWDTFFKREELTAVRRAKRKYAMMTRNDVERVRRARRDEIAFGDVEPPKVEPFEFFVIREVAAQERSDADPHALAIPAGEIMVVGWYDGETEQVEMAPWEDVKRFLT